VKYDYHKSEPHLRYRAEIDGLRAVAVIPVILFHAGFHAFSGGFVGVDIFFVISGYLITTIILSDLEAGKFSLARFYERRARRILPALFIVMALCAIPSYLTMLPDELKSFGQSVVASTAMANNVLLTITSGYWELDSEFKPLLHTWSLGVEEQYYVMFPLLLMLAWRIGRRWLLPTLAILLVLSIGLAQWASQHYPTANFFLLPTRGWEILIGAFVSFHLHGAPDARLPVVAREALSFLGLGLIVYGIFAFDALTPFPSFYTLVPTVGTALIILFASGETAVGRLLSIKAVVGVGLISYSVYLLHQPLIAYARLMSTEQPGPVLLSVLIFVTLVGGYLMWRFVETPTRNRQRISLRLLATSLAISACALFGFGMVLHRTEGFAASFYGKTKYGQAAVWTGYNDRNLLLAKPAFSPDSGLKVLIVGNSYARDFANMLRESFPLHGVQLVYRIDLYDCDLARPVAKNRSLFDSADVIILGSGKYTPACVRPLVTWAEAAGKQLFYLGAKNFGFNLNQVKWKRLALPPAEAKLLFSKRLPSEIEVNADNARAIPAAHYLPLMKLIANDSMVRITDDAGLLLSVDRYHLTQPGARYLGRRFHDDPNPLSELLQSRE
jgi:peptidoglycan/LPS O-acetylase OafA/YrhL